MIVRVDPTTKKSNHFIINKALSKMYLIRFRSKRSPFLGPETPLTMSTEIVRTEIPLCSRIEAKPKCLVSAVKAITVTGLAAFTIRDAP